MEMEKTDHLCGVNDDRKSVCDKEEKIGQLLSELLESERSYVQDLNQVISSPQYSGDGGGELGQQGGQEREGEETVEQADQSHGGLARSQVAVPDSCGETGGRSHFRSSY